MAVTELELLKSLKEVTLALQTHLDDETKRLGVKPPHELCPCKTNEVARALALIKKYN